jgi:hypothetical protein
MCLHKCDNARIHIEKNNKEVMRISPQINLYWESIVVDVGTKSTIEVTPLHKLAVRSHHYYSYT